MRGHPSRVRLTAVAVALALLLATAASPLSAAAQEGGELSGAETGWVGAPPPEDCRGEAATAEEIASAMAEPASEAEIAFPLVVQTEAELPAGEPADEADIEAASAVTWEALACLNAGDFGRFFGLFTPEGVRAFYAVIIATITAAFAGPGATPTIEYATPTAEDLADFEASLSVTLAASPIAIPEAERGTISAIREGRTLPDGRVLLLIDGNIGTPGTIFMVFREVDGRWMIDAFGQIGGFTPPAL
jgi:hypothetical protein